MPFRSKKSNAGRLRLFFATDVHGSEPTFRKFINAGKIYGVDALILGGDITGKLLTPILATGDQEFRATLQNTTHTLRGPQELVEFEARLGKLGFYSCVVSESEYGQLAGDPHRVTALFHQKASERLAAWVRLAEERLADTDIRCYVTGGNDDAPVVLEALQREAKDRVVPCEDRMVALDDEGHSMISLGYSNPTPWKTPREIEDEELGQRLEQAIEGVADFSRAIFNLHVPPVDSTLDTCPALDTSTDPPTVITSGGQPVYFGAGSQSVRRAIEQHQPLASLHGHIHESRGVIQIGRTTAVNPGSEYGEGILRGVIMTLRGDQVESTQMTSG
jgi:Icc-related predicted phosphoesterase